MTATLRKLRRLHHGVILFPLHSDGMETFTGQPSASEMERPPSVPIVLSNQKRCRLRNAATSRSNSIIVRAQNCSPLFTDLTVTSCWVIAKRFDPASDPPLYIPRDESHRSSCDRTLPTCHCHHCLVGGDGGYAGASKSVWSLLFVRSWVTPFLRDFNRFLNVALAWYWTKFNCLIQKTNLPLLW